MHELVLCAEKKKIGKNRGEINGRSIVLFLLPNHRSRAHLDETC